MISVRMFLLSPKLALMLSLMAVAPGPALAETDKADASPSWVLSITRTIQGGVGSAMMAMPVPMTHHACARAAQTFLHRDNRRRGEDVDAFCTDTVTGVVEKIRAQK